MGLSRQITGDDKRGSSYDRRARRRWLVSAAAGFGGDGTKVPCWECGRLLTEDQVISDRIVPGEDGGRYIRSNIRPQCSVCSHRQGARRTNAKARELSPYGDDDLCKSCSVHWLAAHTADCTYLLAGQV